MRQSRETKKCTVTQIVGEKLMSKKTDVKRKEKTRRLNALAQSDCFPADQEVGRGVGGWVVMMMQDAARSL